MPKGKSGARREFAGGGVVYKRSRKGLYIAFILDPYGKWTFAKGHVESGESMEDAALRETEEEMGLKGLRLVLSLGKMEIWFREQYRHGKPVKKPGSLIHKIIYYYLMEAPRSARAEPEIQEKIQAVRWVPLSDARAVAGYKNIQPILAQAIATLRGKMV